MKINEILISGYSTYYYDTWNLQKIQSEFDPHRKKTILISGYNTTMVHGTDKGFIWYLTLTEKNIVLFLVTLPLIYSPRFQLTPGHFTPRRTQPRIFPPIPNSPPGLLSPNEIIYYHPPGGGNGGPEPPVNIFFLASY